eukprot:tig00000157_g9627.t1
MAAAVFPAQGTSSPVLFGDGFSSTDFKLIELPPDVLGELRDGIVSIRGSEDEEAVLCTSARTFQLRLVESSNTTLLFRPRGESDDAEKKGAEVTSAVTGHLEIVEIAPRTEKLRRLLLERPYAGPEPDAVRRLDDGALDEAAEEPAEADGAEGAGEGRRVRRRTGEGRPQRRGLYTFAELRGHVQASDEQLRAALRELHAFEVDGYWRVLDPNALREAMDLLLLTAVERDWRLDELSLREALEALASDVDALVLEHTGAGGDLFRVDLDRVCVFRARQLLAAGPRMRLDDFVEAWRGCVPEGARPTSPSCGPAPPRPAGRAAGAEGRQGLAITEGAGADAFVLHYPASALPLDPPQRFAALFRQRARWALADLEPYVRGLVQPGQTLEQLLLKHTRASRDLAQRGAPIYYTARD